MFHTKKFSGGGFVFVEFAIALPLLILLLCGLSYVGTQIFKLGRDQLADYVLEEEAHYVMERITHQARAARTVEGYNSINSLSIYYRTSDNGNAPVTVDDVREVQHFLTYDRQVDDGRIRTLYAKRTKDGIYSTPITGANSFGETKINRLYCSELNENVLHVTLEMESLTTGKKIILNTAVFMPSCTSKTGLPHEE